MINARRSLFFFSWASGAAAEIFALRPKDERMSLRIYTCFEISG